MAPPSLSQLDLTALYLLLPLAACVICSVCALALYRHDPNGPGNRVATVLVSGAAWWAAMQVLWVHTREPQLALWLHKLAVPGWVFLGPLSLHLMSDLSRLKVRWIRNTRRPLYAIAGLFGVLQITTPWMHSQAVPEPWGWGFVPGPAQVAFTVFTLGCTIPAIAVGLGTVGSAPSPAERKQLRLLTVGFAVPLILISVTGAFLPMLGIQVPRLGAASVAFLAAILVWSYYRYGFSALSPGTFTSEIVETLPVGVCLLDPEGLVLRANTTMARLAGVEVGALAGTPVENLFEQGESTGDRDLADEECSLTPLSDSAPPIPVAVSTSKVYDRRNLRLGTVLVARDLREMVRLRRRLVTSGRMAAVGELAAGIAHEINNPMAYVRANLSHLTKLWSELGRRLPHPGADPELDALRTDGLEMIEESLEGVDRTTTIVRDVKSFAHAGTGGVESVDLESVLRDVLRVAEPQIRYIARAHLDAGGVPCVPGRPQELKQVFLNLIMNAAQACKAEEGQIQVRTRLDGEHVIIEVEDDGCGIAEADLERIFDPFFTTKPVGEGTGLGLAISHEILTNHGAEIVVDSTPGSGTIFVVQLPVHPRDPRHTAADGTS